MNLNAETFKSLHVKACAGQAHAEVGTATAFILSMDGSDYLITNWHVVTGKHPASLECIRSDAVVPDVLGVSYLSAPLSAATSWVVQYEPLYDEEGAPRWLEHPLLRNQFDVVALPLAKAVGTYRYPYVPDEAAKQFMIAPSDVLSVVGFPFGLSGGNGTAIWVSASVASEPEVNLGSLPRFFIDARTRQGQSGSPVIFYRSGGVFVDVNGQNIGRPGPHRQLVGVYSGRVNSQSDLGFVWKIDEVFDVVRRGVVGDRKQWKTFTDDYFVPPTK